MSEIPQSALDAMQEYAAASASLANLTREKQDAHDRFVRAEKALVESLGDAYEAGWQRDKLSTETNPYRINSPSRQSVLRQAAKDGQEAGMHLVSHLDQPKRK